MHYCLHKTQKRRSDVPDIHLHPAWCKTSHVTDTIATEFRAYKVRYALAYLIGNEVHMGAALDCAYGVDEADLQGMA